MIDPIWEIMEHQGRTLEWLARRTGVPSSSVRKFKCGAAQPPASFRAACAKVLDIPEHVLFLSSECPSVGRTYTLGDQTQTNDSTTARISADQLVTEEV